MKIWNQAPMIRLLLPFVAGILLAVHFPYPHFNLIPVSSVLFGILAAVVLIQKFNPSYRRSFVFGAILNSLIVLLAYQLTVLHIEKFSAHHFSNHKVEHDLVKARLTAPPAEKERSVKTVLEVMAVKRGEDWVACHGKALVYFKTDSLALQLRYGDEVLLRADFNEVKGPQNPAVFDYKSFLSFHNVYHQAYVKSEDWLSSGKNSGNKWMQYSVRLRSKLLEILKRNKLSGDELSVGAALLLGYTDKLDAELLSAYSSTGALHVLSVSGLHVAIVYVVFNWFLFFLDKNIYARIVKALFLLLFLWFYAALTGLSPSVLRAATMFSFIVIAKATDKHSNIYNTLAASAFFLLLTDPFLIMEVGFQLSYLAVIGIVYMQPKIYALFSFDNWLLDQSWNVTAVSVAAQVATFPLGLYYFHQFPNYFLISNLIVIPVSTFIIYVGIALFAFSGIPLASKYLSLAFGWLIWFLNASVKWIESLPFSVLEGISLSFAETILLYCLIVVLLFYLSLKKHKYLLAAFAIFCAIMISQALEQRQQFAQKKLVVYSVPKTTAIDFIYGKNNVLWTDSIFANDRRGLLFHIKPNWWKLGTESRIVTDDLRDSQLCIKNNLAFFKGQRLFILDKKIRRSGAAKLKLDYLIVSGNVKMKAGEFLDCFDAKVVVFDASNSEFRVKNWIKECRKEGQKYYSVRDSGAMVIDL